MGALSLGTGLAGGGLAAPSLPPILLSGPALISGDDQPAGLLSLAPVDVTAPSGAVLGIEWLRDGQPVPGQTAPDYAKSGSDTGAALRVRLRASAAGHATRLALSNLIQIAAAAGWSFSGSTILAHPAVPAAPTVSGHIVEV